MQLIRDKETLKILTLGQAEKKKKLIEKQFDRTKIKQNGAFTDHKYGIRRGEGGAMDEDSRADHAAEADLGHRLNCFAFR